MKRITYHISLLSLLLIAILFTGCKSKKNLIDQQSLNVNIQAYDVVSNALAAQPDFSTMNISKMSMSLSYGQYSFTFRGSIRVAKDSLVSVSIQPALGIEMYRLEFTPDGFALYDKINRKYSHNSYNYLYLQTGVNVEYSAIEALFSHQLFTPQSVDTKVLLDAFELTNTSSDTIQLMGKQSIATYRQHFEVARPLYRITLTGLNKDNHDIASISYGELKKSNGILFPQSINLRADITKSPINVQLNFDKIAFNDKIVIAPINLNRYTKTALTDIISLTK